MSTCTIPRISAIPVSPLDHRWDVLPRLPVGRFHPLSSDHHPEVIAQLGHSGTHLYLRFIIRDRYVASRTVVANGPVCTDSCVEFFVEPIPGCGYFNLEFNAGGTPHCSHITDPTPVPEGFAGCNPFSVDELRLLSIATTLPSVIDPEITTPLDWALSVRIPIAVFARRLGRSPSVPGTWRGNLYKCADRTSHPHWASWAPIDEQLAFHVPHRFGTLHLAP